MFPEQPAHLILNNDIHVSKAQAIGIPVTFFEPSEYQNRLLAEMAHGLDFRQGFWRFTLERLFALETFHNQHPTDSILHVESDVLLLNGFPFSELLHSERLSWTSYNEKSDVSAILFSPLPEETSWLAREIENLIQVDKNLTDMTVLAVIRASHPDRVSLLRGVKEAFESGESNCYDSAVMGMWLCGEDPRNHYGLLKLHNNSAFLIGSTNYDPSGLKYCFDRDSGLHIQFKSKSMRMNCLHLHSKNLNFFGENWEQELLKYIEISNNSKPVVKFLPSVLIKLLKDNQRQKTLIPFLLGIPTLYKLRMFARKKLKR